VVTLQLEASGLVILQTSEHLWPEDLEGVIPVFHAAHGASRGHEAKLWLLSLSAAGPFPPIHG
jgi:hypothetical protein